jgi:DNA primase
LDFEQIKKASILEVLKRYGVTLKGRGDWHYAKCPLPTHESKDSRTSFGVNVPQNFWLCHSDSCRMNKGNKKGGDVINLVQVLEKCSMLQAAQKLVDWYGLNESKKATASNGTKPKESVAVVIPPDSTELPKESKTLTAEPMVNKPLSFAGFKDLDSTHEYLRGRGIRITTAEEFGIGYFGGRSSVIKDPYRIVIPVHNAAGFLVAYVGRSLDAGAEEKYHFPPGFLKTLELYNVHRVMDDTAICVEGFFSVMHLWQGGFQNTVGLMGSTISEAQLLLLKRFRSVVLMLDGDKAGREATDVIAAKIAKQQFVTAVMLGDGQQPDHLSGEELRSFLHPILG